MCGSEAARAQESTVYEAPFVPVTLRITVKTCVFPFLKNLGF